MTTTTFVDGTTVILASWLNDVNTGTYTTLPLKAPLISPSFTTPVLGVASVTTLNKLTFTQPGTSATLTIADGKTLTASNTLIFTGTDGSTLNVGTGGTLGTGAYSVTGTNTGDQTIASTATIKTGTNNTQIISPLGALNAFGFSGYFQSADQTITAAGALTLPHGLGRAPILVQPFLKCVSATAGYSIGDITPVFQVPTSNSGVSIVVDATNINIRYGSSANVFLILDKSAGTNSAAVNASWSFFVRVWA